MVGDRRFDVEGGRAVGLHTVGVGYGYGTEEELRRAGCEAYAATVEELIGLLCPGQEAPAGAFLSMEGVDGSGKTTQMDLLEDGLDRYGFEVVRSREPGGCPVAEEIRRVLLDRKNVGMTDVTEALLYAASRAQHVRQVIRPAVKAGKVLLSDRSWIPPWLIRAAGGSWACSGCWTSTRPRWTARCPCARFTWTFLPRGAQTPVRGQSARPDRDGGGRVPRTGGGRLSGADRAGAGAVPLRGRDTRARGNRPGRA
jgi:hypothetical protein